MNENVENVIRQIKENIKTRREYNNPTETNESKSLDYVKSNWDIQNVEYTISSHRPIIGRLLVWGRRLIYGEVRRYVDLIAKRQIEFNSRTADILNNLDRKINESVISINTDIDRKINESVVSINTDMRKLPSSDDTDDIMNYFTFEDKYRGTPEEVKQRQSIFLQYFKNCKNVLDIGCGRGDFLSLLKEKGIGAKGIDINNDMVLFCKKNDLDVIQIDALSYLDSLKDKSLDGVFSGQLVEHLQPNELINLVKLCHDKMIYGTYLVLETQNPLCLSILSKGFYIDLSHIKPVHPETLKFLLESVRFRGIHVKFLSQVPDEDRLDKLAITENMNDNEKVYIDIMNKNIDKLNSSLFGYQDYAIIGKK